MFRSSMRESWTRWIPMAAVLSLVALGLLTGTTALAGDVDPFGGDVTYRTLFDEKDTLGFLNPRVIIWILAQLHLLLACLRSSFPCRSELCLSQCSLDLTLAFESEQSLSLFE